MDVLDTVHRHLKERTFEAITGDVPRESKVASLALNEYEDIEEESSIKQKVDEEELYKKINTF